MPMRVGEIPCCGMIRSSAAMEMLTRFRWLIKQSAINNPTICQRIAVARSPPGLSGLAVVAGDVCLSTGRMKIRHDHTWSDVLERMRLKLQITSSKTQKSSKLQIPRNDSQ